MKLKTSLIVVILFIFSSVAFAQKTDPIKVSKTPPAAAKMPTVKEILAKYVKAIGGREAVERVKSRSMSGTIELAPMGIKGTFETYSTGEAKSYTKTDLAGIGEILDGTDGITGWNINPMTGSRDKTGAEMAQSKINANFYRDINLEKLFPKMELKGIEKVGDKDTYVVVATAEGIPSETWYFDTTSGLMLRADSTLVSPEGNQSAKVFFDEMKTVDGVQVPVKIRTQLPQFELIMIATDVKQNIAIDDAKFKKPKI